MLTTALAVRFLAELAAIAAAGYWGFGLTNLGMGRIAMGIAAPVALVLVWYAFIAPRGPSPLPPTVRELAGSAILLLAAGALALAGQPMLGLAFATAVVVDQLILLILGSAGRVTGGVSVA